MAKICIVMKGKQESKLYSLTLLYPQKYFHQITRKLLRYEDLEIEFVK